MMDRQEAGVIVIEGLGISQQMGLEHGIGYTTS
jgi:hypothetical protein